MNPIEHEENINKLFMNDEYRFPLPHYIALDQDQPCIIYAVFLDRRDAEEYRKCNAYKAYVYYVTDYNGETKYFLINSLEEYKLFGRDKMRKKQ
jgi:hypothetical protein